ncbi:MAG: D-alanine--D-alanine ligase [Ruminococcaceae bacterium]|nr:D-alanine--D-alanine ligase [Oscillospiraceae bacterium]
MNIVVLAGGISPERDVSLTSAALIANALTRSGHRVLLVDVYEGLNEGTDPSLELFSAEGNYSYKVDESIPDLDAVIAKNGGRKVLIGPGVLEVCALADVVYIGLHGAMGENGQLQATLDNYGIKYTGSGYIGSLLAMDKDISKKLLSLDGIPTPAGVTCSLKNDDVRSIVKEMGLPCVIKPCSCGSSVGVSIIENEKELDAALSFAEKYEDKVLIEKKIVGREMTVAILDGEVLPAIEIIPKNGYYDYKNKYQSGMTEELCPAPITDEQFEKMADYTRRAFKVLNLRGLARMDYILTEDGEAYCLEANTLPGMTPTSLLPQAAAAVGIGYDELCDKIVKMALK